LLAAKFKYVLLIAQISFVKYTVYIYIVRGLPTILQRWQGQGFGMDLQDLLAILKRSSRGGPYTREYHVWINHNVFLLIHSLIYSREKIMLQVKFKHYGEVIRLESV